MTNLAAGEKELLRHAVLECLAARHPAALPVAGVTRRVAQEVDFKVDQGDVHAALVILREKELVRYQLDELGSSQWWCATAAGVLQIERIGNA
jgi:hypothetical protein